MKTLVFVLAGSLLVSGTCLGAMPVPGVPTTAPAVGATVAAATAPAEAAEATGIKGVLEKFIRGVFAGDEAGVLELTYVADAAGKAEVEVFLGKTLADQMWERALAEAFKDQVGKQEMSVPEEQMKELAGAKVTVAGDTARVEMGHDVVTMIRDKGVWKVDLIKTLHEVLSPMEQKEMASAGPEVKVRSEMMAEVKAGKFKTAGEAKAELSKRLAALEEGAKPAAPAMRDPKAAATMANLANLKMALDVFEMDNGRYPTTAEGLEALVHKPAGMEAGNWHPLIEQVPVDGWGHVFIYAYPGKNEVDFELSSAGADGKLGTADDINTNTQPTP